MSDAPPNPPAEDVAALRARIADLEWREAMHRALVEHTLDAITVIDRQGVIRFQSPSSERILGYAPPEMVGRSVLDFVHPDDHGMVLTELARGVVEPRYAASLVLRLRHRDGGTRVLEAAARSHLDDPVVQGIVIDSRDITERRQMDEALQRTDQMLQAIIRAAPLTIVTFDVAGRVLSWNPAAERVYGWAVAEVMGRPMPHVAEESREVHERITQGVAAGQTFNNVEVRRRCKNGGLLDTIVAAAPLRDAQGRIIGGVGMGMDVTPHKKAEQALRESEARTRALLDAVPDMIFRMNSQGVYLDLHAENVDDLLVPPSRIVGANIHELPFPEDLRRRMLEAVRRATETGRIQTLEYTLDLHGQTYAFEARIVRSGADETVAIVRNITERKQAEEALRAMASELVLTQERERRRLASDLHDQIGQLLALAKIKLEVLRESAEAQRVRPELDEVGRLIEESIQYTRSVMAELSPPVLYELGFVAAAEWLAEHVQQRHGVDVRFRDDGADKPLDESVRAALFGAVRELLMNVVKHAKVHRANLTVAREDQRVTVVVEDAGVGFDPATVAAPRPADGAGGFGLFSMRERLSRLGGSVAIQAAPGRGARVTLTAPLQSPPRGSDPEDAAP